MILNSFDLIEACGYP